MAGEGNDVRGAPLPIDETRALGALGEQLRHGPPPDVTTRIHLADLLLAAGREEEAVEAFLGLADELARAGLVARAFGVLKKAEALRPESAAIEERLGALAREQQRLVAETSAPRDTTVAAAGSPASTRGETTATRRPKVVPPPLPGRPKPPPLPGRLAPLAQTLSEIGDLLDAAEPMPRTDQSTGGATRAKEPTPAFSVHDDDLDREVLDLVAETLRRPAVAEPSDTMGRRLLAAPLFAELALEELAAVIRRLRLRTYSSGDILVTEGETGQSLSILSDGWVKVFVRSPTGRDVQVAQIEEGDFFGEVSAISGSRRTATIIAAAPCEVLELGKEDLDDLARAHPRVRDRLDAAFVQRAGSPVSAVVRAIDITAQGHVGDQARLALKSRFGRSHWDARMRLRLAAALIGAGHEDEALPILAEAATGLLRAGRSDAAAVLLKKVESFHFRDVVEIHLAPLRRALEAEPLAGTAPQAGAGIRDVDPVFQHWLIRMARERLGRAEGRKPETAPERPPEGTSPDTLAHFGPGLRASPLFESLSDGDLLALVQGLRLFTVEAGDVVLTEGEQGESLLVIVSGSVKIWSRDGDGHNACVCQLDEGSFFGEVATLSGRPRSASVTSAERSVLLEVNRENLAAVREQHPHVGEVLQAQFIRRVSTG
jgi:CRP-like cAMP-binding protein